MMILPVAAARPRQVPTVILEPLDQFPNLHLASLAGQASLLPQTEGTKIGLTGSRSCGVGESRSVRLFGIRLLERTT